MKLKSNSYEIFIKGMDCPDCVSRVDQAIQSVPNVSDVKVFLGSEKARIEFRDVKPDFRLIYRAIYKVGYEASLIDSKTTANKKEGKDFARPHISTLTLILSAVILLALLGEWSGLLKNLTKGVSWYFWLLAIIAGGWPIFRNVIRSAIKGKIIAHSLMTLGVIAAIAVGEWPTAAVIVLFMRIGDFVEAFTTDQSRGSIRDLEKLMPQTARVEKNREEIITPIGQVNIGDLIIVHPGESIPVDGIVKDGSAMVDQSAISGESMPVSAEPGKKIFAASIISSGMLKIVSTSVGSETTYSQVIRLVEEAEGNRAEVQRLADRFAGYFMPVVIFIALMALIIRRDPLAAAATLVVACSCSFTLATPVAMLASIGSAAKKGLLIKGGKYLEQLAKADTLFIDKTGTLTIGKPQISDILPLGKWNKGEVLNFVAAVEQYSEHPLADAVNRYAYEQDIKPLNVKKFRNKPGKGVSGEVSGYKVEIINEFENCDDIQSDDVDRFSAQGKTTFFVKINGIPAGLIAAEDMVRREVKESIEKIKAIGIKRIVLLSGDKKASVKNLADNLGIDYRAGLLPEEKLNIIRKAQTNGACVVMVGDGINDAPALAQADVGIAMGAAGSDLAIEAAHIALLRDDWMLVPQVFFIARRTMSVVRTNILFTFFYNLFGMSLAAFGILPPIMAAALQSLPDVGILANSARLMRK